MTLKMAKEEIFNQISDIEGWLSDDDANILYDTVSCLENKGAMVEIGSWCGRSLILTTLTAFVQGNDCLKYTIDPFLTSKDEPNGKYETFVSNLTKLGLWEKIIHIKEKSQIAGEKFEKPVEFVFIDGFHRYEFVKKDFELFSSKLVDKGYIAFHDVGTYYGPTKLMEEILEQELGYSALKYAGSTFLLQKNVNITAEDKSRNAEFLHIIKELLNNKELVM